MNKQKVKWFKAGYDKAKKEDLEFLIELNDIIRKSGWELKILDNRIEEELKRE